MKYFANIIAFEFFYIFIYLLPTGLLFKLYEEKIKEFVPPSIASYLTLFLGIIIIIAFLFSGYRAKVAAKCKVDSNMKFLEAHRASWAIIKANLSFLPIIGSLFKNKDE
jgi:hypothetical protein